MLKALQNMKKQTISAITGRDFQFKYYLIILKLQLKSSRMRALGFFLIIFLYNIKLLNRFVYKGNIINLKFPGIINHLKSPEFCIGQSIKQKDVSLRHTGVTDSLTHDYFPCEKYN